MSRIAFSLILAFASAGAQTPVKPTETLRLPVDMRVCAAACTDWIGTAEQFYLKWPTGVYSSITVESFTPKSVIMHRVDLPGTQSPGLKADYTGQISGNGITGTVAFTWPGHPGFPASTKFTATWEAAALSPTAILHRTPVEVLHRQMEQASLSEQQAQLIVGLMGLLFLSDDDASSAKSSDQRWREGVRRVEESERRHGIISACGTSPCK